MNSFRLVKGRRNGPPQPLSVQLLLALLMRKTKAFYLYAIRPTRTTGLLQQCITLRFYFQFLEGFGEHIHNIMTKSMSLFICIWQENKNKKVVFIILVRQVLQRPSLGPYSLTMDDTKQSAPLCKKREASIHIH